MNAQEAAIEANKAINQWSRENSKLIVAIDGYTGVGKTTILKNILALNSDVVEVNRDDFVLSRQATKDALATAEDASKFWELESTRTHELEKLMRAFKEGASSFETKVFNPKSGALDLDKKFDLTKKVLIIEGVFLFHPKLLNHLWDKRIYLEGNIDAIDKRRVAREKEKWGADYFPETHPDSYLRHIIIALKRYFEIHRPADTADLVLKID